MPVAWESEILLYELTCQSRGQSGRTIITRLCSVRSMARKLATSGPRQVGKADMVAYMANVGFGVGFGPVGAVVSAWPAVAFIGAAEMALGMIEGALRHRARHRAQ